VLNTLELMVYDLEASGVCSLEVALNSTLSQNLSRTDALVRRNARAQLLEIGSLQGAIGAAFSEEGSKSLAATIRRIQHMAGLKPTSATPSATPMGRLVGVE
jgi:hypothetical protein